MKKEMNIALFESRHKIPQACDGSIFDCSISSNMMTDPDALEKLAYTRFLAKQVELGIETTKGLQVNLYVTGLTVALIAVINALAKTDTELTLYHYDRDTNSYYPQKVKR